MGIFWGFLRLVWILIFNDKGLIMVLRTQTDFVKFLEQVLEVLKEVEIDKTECYTLLESVQKQQLFIPVVGNFSAGKSTLLNRFLEKSVLPTGITPETSLATELHYSANERIEAFSNNDEKAESFELNEQSFEVIKKMRRSIPTLRFI